jgi:methyl-accepting chemotaxis protein
MTIRTKFSLSTLAIVALALAELALVGALLWTQTALGRARQIQHESERLATELRYSSDELTRTARMYAVTGDRRYRDEYWQILAVRDGQAPRPDGRTVPMRRLLQDVGISADELALLRRAEDESNALVATEVAAFQALEGRFLPDGVAMTRDPGAYTRRGAPDGAWATRIMHDPKYAADKERIMAPIRAFEASVASRTGATVDRLAARSRTLMLGVAVLVSALVVIALVTSAVVQRPVLRSIALVARELDDLAAGDMQVSRRIGIARDDEIGALATAFNAALDKVADLVREVREAAASVVGRAADIGNLLARVEQSVQQQEASTQSTSVATREIATTSAELQGSTQAMGDAARRTSDLVAEGERGLQRIGATMAALLDANRQIVGTLAVINDKASHITTMADVIRRVADQTELLSFNAAIEAEKAGAYGFGFGAVAREIRRLADQSAAAIEDIETVVRDVRQAIGGGVGEMDRFCARLAESVSEVQAIEGQLAGMIREVQALLPLLQDLGASFTAQDAGVQQIRADMQALTAHARSTAEALARAGEDRTQVEQTGRRLRELVEQMRT